MTGAQTVGLGIQVYLLCCDEPTGFSMLTVVSRMGQLECEWKAVAERDGGDMADIGSWTLAGHIPMHAMRLAPPEARYPHLQDQVFEHGQLVQ